MAQVSTSRRESYGDSQERVFERRDRRRSQSVSSLGRRSWAPEREFGEILQRSASLISKAKRLPQVIPQCIQAIDSHRLYKPGEDEDYDSDEEDRRNGVPITVSENRGCELTPSLKAYIFLEKAKRLDEKHRLKKLLSVQGSKYFSARKSYFECHGQNWNVSTWESFLVLEDIYFEMVDKLRDLDFEIEHFNTALISFGDHYVSGSWIREDGLLTWSPSSDSDVDE
ncbi:hypothetical protein AAE478_009559 [Parahypoxylon ruwenzoriense]